MHSLELLQSETKLKICQLEKAIISCGREQSELKRSIDCVKNSIVQTVDNLLQTLRSRETWLLNHADDIYLLKKTSLEQQVDGLQQLADELKTCLVAVEQGLDDENAQNSFKTCLHKASLAVLHPVESSEMSFTMENNNLRQLLIDLGKIKVEPSLPDNLDEEFELSSEDNFLILRNAGDVRMSSDKFFDQESVELGITKMEISEPMGSWLLERGRTEGPPESLDNSSWLMTNSSFVSSDDEENEDDYDDDQQWLARVSPADRLNETSAMGEENLTETFADEEKWLTSSRSQSFSWLSASSAPETSVAKETPAILDEMDEILNAHNAEFLISREVSGSKISLQQNILQHAVNLQSMPNKDFLRSPSLSQSASTTDQTCEQTPENSLLTSVTSQLENIAKLDQSRFLVPKETGKGNGTTPIQPGIVKHIAQLQKLPKEMFLRKCAKSVDHSLCKWLTGRSATKCEECGYSQEKLFAAATNW